MSKVVIFRYSATGAIEHCSSMPNRSHIELILNDPGEFLWMLGTPGPNKRVDVSDSENHVLADKINIPNTVDKTTITADGTDKASFSGLIESTIVDFAGLGVVEIDETGLTDFGIDVPGTYDIVLSHGAYYSQTITITAEAP